MSSDVVVNVGSTTPAGTVPPSVTQQPAVTQNYGSSNTFDNIASGVSNGSISGTTSTGTTTPGASNQQEAPPSASTSPYEYQQYIAVANVVLGPEIANLLGLPANQPVSGDKIVRAYYDMSHANLVTLQSMLYYSGLYQTTAGTTYEGQPDLGAYNVDGYNALSLAILDVANGEGSNLSAMVAQRIAQNTGITQQESNMAPQQGGGGTYQITLPNPQDIYQTAYSTFESALGRAPDQQELQAIQAALDAQTTAYQQSLNAQAEQMSQQKYAATLSSQSKMNTPIVVGPDGKPTSQNAQKIADAAAKAPPPKTQPPPPVDKQGGQPNEGPPLSQAPSNNVVRFGSVKGGANPPGTGTPDTNTAVHPGGPATPGNPTPGAQVTPVQSGTPTSTTPSTTGVPTSTPFLQSPGDQYIPPNTLTTTQAPSASGAAFTAATTGKNAVPYLFNQYLNAFNAVVSMIKNGGMTS